LTVQSKEDYKFYLEADRIALGVADGPMQSAVRLGTPIWEYERLLRRAEHYSNCKKGAIWRPITTFARLRAYSYGYKLGFEIPLNTFGPGLSIAHHGSIILNPLVRIGENCKIHNGVTIGSDLRQGDHCPTVGDNVFIGPGVQMFGKITIGNNIAIGANSVVNKSFPEDGISIAGAPAEKISDKGFHTAFVVPRSSSGTVRPRNRLDWAGKGICVNGA
jgi:serine O-acetyltransferase